MINLSAVHCHHFSCMDMLVEWGICQTIITFQILLSLKSWANFHLESLFEGGVKRIDIISSPYDSGGSKGGYGAPALPLPLPMVDYFSYRSPCTSTHIVIAQWS